MMGSTREDAVAHTGSCANSNSNRCRCSCGGTLHGGGRAGTSFSYIQGPHDVFPGRSTRIVHSDDTAQRLAVEIFGRLIESHGNLPAAASDCIVDMVGEAFGVKGRKRRRLRANHTVCRILVEIVKALDYIGKQPPRMIGRAVAAAWPSDEPTVAALAGKAAEIVAAAIYKAATGGQLDVIIYDCRVLAIVTCPDMDRHHEVAEVCAGPLLQGKLSEHLKGDLERIVSNYRGTRATARTA
jgi:hypothetical protein